MSASQWKGSFAVIEAYVLPTAGCMASRTLGSELAFVHIFDGMAREAVFRSTFENPIHVTCSTGNLGMQAG
jgi:hypothetical protein